MKSDELRALFLSFFEEKGHKVIPSSSLIPAGDPTLLLTNAGMVQIKPYFLGEAVPPSRRLASCQKCFRTSDIESVGDATHCTFFEMLGNFSVGDYFKKEAIAWAWEFITERLKIPEEKLWVTIYLDDDEAFTHWRAIGVPEKKISRFGEEDNFWGPAGSSGPCGPCSEIHYDFGIEKGCGKADCRPNCECGRFTELWNLVFTQYNQDEKGNRTPLPKPNIDTGMGLERLVTVMQGKKSVYETDLFDWLIDNISQFTGKKYGADEDADKAMRVVVEHGRASTFLVADGVFPSNEGRGYVLRRLIRRATLFGRRLGLNKPFLNQITGAVVASMAGVYPELKKRQEYLSVIGDEERRFDETLNIGLGIIDNILSKTGTKKAKKISGGDAFKLYDTYGFPVELTKEIVSRQGFSVDMSGFEKEMEKQRERARASHKFGVALELGGANRLDVAGTEFVGYTCLEQKAKLVKLLIDSRPADAIEKGQKASLILNATPFYAEMGGQVGDTGEIISKTGKFTVTDTVRLPPDLIIHQGEVVEGSFKAGDEVRAVVDIERRRDIMRNHTATHLLQAALRQVLGDYIQQRGSLVAPDRLRFDFSHLSAMTPDEIKSVQRIVNERVRQNIKVCDEETDYKKAIASGATALFDEKYGDVVRVMRIGEPSAPPVSAELCGGTHVSYTGEIGYFHIISEGSIGAGLRRIEAVTGRAAEVFIDQRLSGIEHVSRSLETAPENVEEKLKTLLAEHERVKKHAFQLERDSIWKDLESEWIKRGPEEIEGIKMFSERISSVDPQTLRDFSDSLKDKLGSGVVVLGTIYNDKPAFITNISSDLVDRGFNAVDIVKTAAKVIGGGGGGKPNIAQAGGSIKNKLDEALELAKKTVIDLYLK